MILCANPRAQYNAHKAEIDTALCAVLENGRYVLGNEVTTFETEFAAFIGVSHAVGVGSGTEALHVALLALGVGHGDEVITVAHTAVATVAAIELCGATAVLVDIDSVSYTINPGLVEARINTRTKAIIPVHLYGQAAELAPILEVAKRHGIAVIEDCAQAHGGMTLDNTLGSLGTAGCFSFYPTKNLGALGDGGMLVTNDAGVAARARQIREYGWVERYVSRTVGLNSRLDEIQAAVLRVKLRYLANDNAARRSLAARYDRGLEATGLELPQQRKESRHVFHLYVVRSRERDHLQKFLAERDIGTLVHYPVPVHLQPAYAGRLPGCESLPETERAAREVLSLPMYPELTIDEADRVIEELNTFAKRIR